MRSRIRSLLIGTTIALSSCEERRTPKPIAESSRSTTHQVTSVLESETNTHSEDIPIPEATPSQFIGVVPPNPNYRLPNDLQGIVEYTNKEQQYALNINGVNVTFSTNNRTQKIYDISIVQENEQGEIITTPFLTLSPEDKEKLFPPINQLLFKKKLHRALEQEFPEPEKATALVFNAMFPPDTKEKEPLIPIRKLDKHEIWSNLDPHTRKQLEGLEYTFPPLYEVLLDKKKYEITFDTSSSVFHTNTPYSTELLALIISNCVTHEIKDPNNSLIVFMGDKYIYHNTDPQNPLGITLNDKGKKSLFHPNKELQELTTEDIATLHQLWLYTLMETENISQKEAEKIVIQEIQKIFK